MLHEFIKFKIYNFDGLVMSFATKLNEKSNISGISYSSNIKKA